MKKVIVHAATAKYSDQKIYDLFQTKTALFSTRALISVHFKTVWYFSQSISSLFSYLKMHNII